MRLMLNKVKLSGAGRCVSIGRLEVRMWLMHSHQILRYRNRSDRLRTKAETKVAGDHVRRTTLGEAVVDEHLQAWIDTQAMDRLAPLLPESANFVAAGTTTGRIVLRHHAVIEADAEIVAETDMTADEEAEAGRRMVGECVVQVRNVRPKMTCPCQGEIRETCRMFRFSFWMI